MASENKFRETRTLEESYDGEVLGEFDDGLHDSQGFAVFGLLGSGGMGVVHEGRQIGLARQVAIKSVLGDASVEQHRDLVREGQVLALLEHPNIVPVYTLRHIDRKPAIVLKKIDGDLWSDRMADEELEWNIEILLKVVDAIRFAHSQGIVHRDLKPSNVMIGAFGEVYVLDWGSAVSTKKEHWGRIPLASAVTRPFGSAPYMAPEMLNPAWAQISETTDVYLLGAILYEIVMGDPPHLAMSKDDMYRKVERSQPSYRRDLPTELVALLQKSMRRDPKQRFESVDELRAALLGFMEHRASCEMLARGQVLLEVLLGASASSRAAEVNSIYRSCKFILRESLRTWPENPGARAALERCGSVMAEYELARAKPEMAARVYEELQLRNRGLSRTIAAARRKKKRKAAHAAFLRNDADVHVAAATRRTVMVGIALLWMVVPLLLSIGLTETSYRSQSAAHVGFLAVCALIIVFTRDWVDSSAVNRGLFKIVLAGGIAAVAVNLGSWMMAVSPEQAQVYHLFVFFVCGLMTMVTIDWRVWPATLGFFLAYLVSARDPTACLYAMSAGNALLAANACVIWKASAAAPPLSTSETSTERG
jgi:serine/threonine-protein kinase